jgi:hypothetical protein
METASDFGHTFGCGYCRDPRNRHNGRIARIASDDTSRTILIRCPSCRALYLVSGESSQMKRITEREAETQFGEIP